MRMFFSLCQGDDRAAHTPNCTVDYECDLVMTTGRT